MTARKSSLDPSQKNKVLNRLKSVRGHLDAVIKMVEEDTYCVQVIKQIAACRAALDRVSGIELENHLAHCLVDQVRAGEADHAIAELMDILTRRKSIA